MERLPISMLVGRTVDELASILARWEPGQNGSVPEDAVSEGGTRTTGEICFVGRIYISSKGDHVKGQVIPSRGGLVVTIDGKEHIYTDYEVMVMDNEVRRHYLI